MNPIMKWAAGFFEDQKGGASSKRVGFYWAFALFTYMVIASVNGRAVNMEIFYSTLGIILLGYGLIRSEFTRKQ
jgi:hypothetical protein